MCLCTVRHFGMDVKLYIRWYLARMENIKVKISKHKGCPWETGLSNFWVRVFIPYCSDMKNVKPLELAWVELLSWFRDERGGGRGDKSSANTTNNFIAMVWWCVFLIYEFFSFKFELFRHLHKSLDWLINRFLNVNYGLPCVSVYLNS